MDKINKRHLVVFTGSGISAESGIPTYRGLNGLWTESEFRFLASMEGWKSSPERVLEFYNIRRRQIVEASPNAAHLAIKEMESLFEVTVITQNVDDLHERAASTSVLHLHGEIMKARSTGVESKIYNLNGKDLNWGDKDDEGYQLRPHIVWFGESILEMEKALSILKKAHLLLICGTSLQVYPAAGLIQEVSPACEVYCVDLDPPPIKSSVTYIQSSATLGVPQLLSEWQSSENNYVKK
jgi:NAD-dependent deacetylase